jgi:hypothetical protein
MTKQELIDFTKSRVYQNSEGAIGGRQFQETLIAMVERLSIPHPEKKDAVSRMIKSRVYLNQTGDISAEKLQDCLIKIVDGLWCHTGTSPENIKSAIRTNTVAKLQGGILQSVITDMINALWCEMEGEMLLTGSIEFEPSGFFPNTTISTNFQLVPKPGTGLNTTGYLSHSLMGSLTVSAAYGNVYQNPFLTIVFGNGANTETIWLYKNEQNQVASMYRSGGVGTIQRIVLNLEAML